MSDRRAVALRARILELDLLHPAGDRRKGSIMPQTAVVASVTSRIPVRRSATPPAPCRRTKIVCTLGPSSTEIETIRQMVVAGLDVARLNFSHGNHDEHAARLEAVRAVEREVGRPVAILADLCGPKIRVGRLESPHPILVGEEIVLAAEQDAGAGELPITFDQLATVVVPGQRILIADGRFRLRVRAIEGARVLCTVETTGVIEQRKGVNLPDSDLPIPCLTPKDIDDLAFAVAHDVDFVALSFVRSGQDVLELRRRLDLAGSRARIVAKIEMPHAIADLDAIIEASDAVMVARGDLGVEVGLTQVPLLQKRIIDASRRAGRTVITATQMLESMIESPEPTRAEVSDVANAILDGTAAVMLSAETANGAHPVHAVEVMAEIAMRNEGSAATRFERVDDATITTVLMHAACEVADEVGASAIAVPTTSGSTPRELSRFRPRQPVVAASSDRTVLRQLAMDWGVVPVLTADASSLEAAWQGVADAARGTGLVAAGDVVVLTGRRDVAGDPESSHLALYRVPGGAASAS